jgi:hypothetical protein
MRQSPHLAAGLIWCTVAGQLLQPSVYAWRSILFSSPSLAAAAGAAASGYRFASQLLFQETVRGAASIELVTLTLFLFYMKIHQIQV